MTGPLQSAGVYPGGSARISSPSPTIADGAPQVVRDWWPRASQLSALVGHDRRMARGTESARASPTGTHPTGREASPGR